MKSRILLFLVLTQIVVFLFITKTLYSVNVYREDSMVAQDGYILNEKQSVELQILKVNREARNIRDIKETNSEHVMVVESMVPVLALMGKIKDTADLITPAGNNQALDYLKSKILLATEELDAIAQFINGTGMRSRMMRDKNVRLPHGDKTRNKVPNANDKSVSSKRHTDKLIQLENNRTGNRSREVCPEVYISSTIGYPLFNTGWTTKNCSYSVPMHKLVTVVLAPNLIDTKSANLLKLINKTYPQIPIVMSTVTNAKHQYTQKNGSSILANRHLVVIESTSEQNPGIIWNKLVRSIKTPYVLIARDIVYFDNDTSLERLVREISELNIDVIGGSVKYPDGTWHNSCRQTAFRNFTLVYDNGYHYSRHECIFCNYSSAPFIARTNFIMNNVFNERIENTEVLFRDFFFRISQRGYKAAVCPDSMFYVSNDSAVIPSRQQWLPFVTRSDVEKLVLENKQRYMFSCGEMVGGTKGKRKGMGLSPCVLKQLSDLIKFTMNKCEESGSICELQEGTLLSAVKLGKAFPWERDADITFHTQNFSTIMALKPAYMAAGYSLKMVRDPWCCVDGILAGGVFMAAGNGWHVEMYGQHRMDSEMQKELGRPISKVLFDGQLVAAPRNPGLFARNRYGHEIYQHQQHWMTTGAASGWELYKPNAVSFKNCPLPGHHACLSHYPTDGNMQFDDPLP